jgi:hypothetical protein
MSTACVESRGTTGEDETKSLGLYNSPDAPEWTVKLVNIEGAGPVDYSAGGQIPPLLPEE